MPYDDARGPVEDNDHPSRRDPVTVAPARADAAPREREQPAPDKAGDKAASRAPDQSSGGGGASKGKDDAPKRHSIVPMIVLAVVILVAIIGGGYYWWSNKDLASTDDAYTDGRAITIASQVSGYVVDLAVTDNQFVKQGDVILRIDPRDYIAARDQARGTLEAAEGQLAASKAGILVARKNFPARLASAQAQLQSARAKLTNAASDARRQHAVTRGATTQQQVDQADAALLQAQADVAQAEAAVQQAAPVQENIDQTAAQASQVEGQVAQARAQLAQAELNIGYTTIRAPQDGWVTKRNVERGNYLTAGASVMSLVSPQVWVTANFKENQLDRMRPGQPVDIEVDAYPSLQLKGHVDSVQLGTGGRFTAFPAENATGNFVKIVQRVPVKIVIDSGLDPKIPLPLGLSVSPVVSLK
jgi:membrane fusion protein (multidrug efflux system)